MDAGVGVRMIMDWWISSVGVCASMMPCILQDVIKVAVTPGFKDKTECITICMPGSSFIYIETSEVNKSVIVSRKENYNNYKTIRVIQLILEMKTPNFIGNRLGAAYA